MSARGDAAFWVAIDALVRDSRMVIDRPKGSTHPRLSSIVYPLDYGYLENTASMDQGGIDIWVGTCGECRADAIVCTVDLMKRDSEIKILLGCTEDEIQTVYRFHNDSKWMKGALIRRDA